MPSSEPSGAAYCQRQDIGPYGPWAFSSLAIPMFILIPHLGMFIFQMSIAAEQILYNTIAFQSSSQHHFQ